MRPSGLLFNIFFEVVIVRSIDNFYHYVFSYALHVRALHVFSEFNRRSEIDACCVYKLDTHRFSRFCTLVTRTNRYLTIMQDCAVDEDA